MSYTSAFRGNNIDSILSTSAATGWVEELVLEAKRATLDAAYPVGSVYISFSNISPGTLFGGTWERLQSCYFYCNEIENDNMNGQTFGSVSHNHVTGDCILTIEQMPAHNHSASGVLYSGQTSNSSTGYAALRTVTLSNLYEANGGNIVSTVGGGVAHNHGTTGVTDIYPPSVRICAWKRIL